MGALTIAILLLLALVVAAVIWLIHISNTIRAKEIKVQESLSGIEVALTKRYDMLTKLMDTARGYLVHERGILTQVVQLRRGMSAEELHNLCQKSSFMDQIASGRIHEFGQHIIPPGQRHLDAGQALLDVNFFCLDPIADADHPDHQYQKQEYQNSN